MRNFAAGLMLLAALSSTTWLAANSARMSPAGLEVVLSNPRGPYFGSDYKVTVYLRNRGPGPVTVVAPGIGSLHEVRTPKVYWIVRRGREPARQLPPPTRGCGNIDPLRAREVIELRARQRVDVTGAAPLLTLTKPGEYGVRLRYVNDPAMKWTGIPLGEHEPEAMRRVRGSTPCDIVSNEITVVVTGPATIR